MKEAIALGSALMENQICEERKDTIDHAWDYICGWVVRNKNKFLTPQITASNSEVYGKIVKRSDASKKAGKKAGNGSDSTPNNRFLIAELAVILAVVLAMIVTNGG